MLEVIVCNLSLMDWRAFGFDSRIVIIQNIIYTVLKCNEDDIFVHHKGNPRFGIEIAIRKQKRFVSIIIIRVSVHEIW